MNLTITTENLIELLKLREAIFNGIEIPQSLSFVCVQDNTFHIDVISDKEGQTKHFLWLKSNWKLQAKILEVQKRKEEKERNFWNLVHEAGQDIEDSIRSQIRKMSKEQAHSMMLQIIEKKSIKNLQIFLKLDPEKYKELLQEIEQGKE